MGVQYFEMRGMIDHALGHPEKGIVNLNILHSLLHEILNHLDNNKTLEKFSDSKDLPQDETDDASEGLNSSDPIAKTQDRTSIIDNNRNGATIRPHKNVSSESTKLSDFEARLVSIETKLNALDSFPDDKSFLTQATQSSENQSYENQPSSNKENNLAMMWKYITTHRRLQATEEAVEKVMVILNNVLLDIGQLKTVKSHLEELRHEQSKMTQEFEAAKKAGGLETSFEKKDLLPFVTWSALEQALNKKKIRSKEDVTDNNCGIEVTSFERPETAPVPSSPRDASFNQDPPKTAMSPKDFYKRTGQNPDEIITQNFTSNEGMKDSLQSSKENNLGEISLHRNDNAITRENTDDSIVQPSPEFLNQLNRIGELPKQYDNVAVQVSMMSELQNKLASDVNKVETDILPRKVDKEDLQLPDNLVQQIDMLKQGLDMLNTNQDLQMLATIKETSVQNKENVDSLRRELAMFSQHLKKLDQLREDKTPEASQPSYDQEVLNSVREKLSNVEQKQETMVLKSKEDIDKILENLDEKQKVIDNLFQYAERLQERKADRENVATEMDIKADKHALADKVNQSTFEETFQMFDRGLQEALQKMEDYMNEEMALKDTLSRISQEMEGKIDGDSLKLMKDYFEKQIKEVQESRDKFARETRMEATDAAGVRRQLPIHYHCISCNRPVELPLRDSEPVLPESESLPYRRMRFPFTSHEEQLRQKAMKGNYNADESVAVRDFVSSRPCGGSHTIVNAQLRKSTKFHQFNQTMAVREDARFVPKLVREVSVLDFLRGSDGHYYKGRSRQLLPAIQRRNKYPSNADVRQEESSGHEQKAGSHYLVRTPSPPVQDNLSSSYPEISESKAPHIQGKRYSSDDLSIPSNTALNRESLKIFRRKRGHDREPRKRWDNQQTNTKGQTEVPYSDSNESTSPKSMKRTTPVGEEQTHTSPESSSQKHNVHNELSGDVSSISAGDKT